MDTTVRLLLLVLSGLACGAWVYFDGQERIKNSASHSGPQCTRVYPRGFELYHRGPKDGPECGTLAEGWGVCIPVLDI